MSKERRAVNDMVLLGALLAADTPSQERRRASLPVRGTTSRSWRRDKKRKRLAAAKSKRRNRR